MRIEKRLLARFALAGLLIGVAGLLNPVCRAEGQVAPVMQGGAETPSPELSGIAHIALRVHDLAASTAFYEKLGFVRAFALSRNDQVYEAFIKINDRQFIELYPATGKDPQAGFLHLCFEANHIQSAHDFYVSQGLKPIDVRKAGAGNLLFTMPGPATPTGPQNIEYTQYMPGSLHSADAGRHLGEHRVADEILSVTLGVIDPPAALAFYRDKLRFSVAPGSSRRLAIPGASAESIQIEPGKAHELKAQFTFKTSAGDPAAFLTKSGVAFSKASGSLMLLDPDGNGILLEPR